MPLMDITEAVMVVMVVGMVVGLPMLALSIRFALKPAIEAWQKAREADAARRPTRTAELEELKLRVAALEAVWEHRLGGGTLKATTPPQLVD